MKFISKLILLFILINPSFAQEFSFKTRDKKIKHIVIGQNGLPEFQELAKSLIVSFKKEKIRSIILVPKDLEENYKETFIRYKKDSFVEFLNISEDKLLWAQDVMAFLDKGGKTYVLDLPYQGRDGENFPEKYAGRYKNKYLNFSYNQKKLLSGDFGGNILPVNQDNVLIGNTASKEFLDYLYKNIKQKIHLLDVSFLKTGHIDEVLSFIPSKNIKNCPGYFLYASPGLAQDLNPKLKKNQEPFIKVMENNLKSLKEIFKGCKKPSFIPLPVYFEKTEEGVRSLYSNPINGIFLNSSFLMAKQPNIAFEKDIISKLKNITMLDFIEAGKLNELFGGLHCMINIERE